MKITDKAVISSIDVPRAESATPTLCANLDTLNLNSFNLDFLRFATRCLGVGFHGITPESSSVRTRRLTPYSCKTGLLQSTFACSKCVEKWYAHKRSFGPSRKV